MDPVSAGLLLAVAGGAGSTIGGQLWSSLAMLVRRASGRNGTGDVRAESGRGPSGVPELSALEAHPGNRDAAQRLASLLTARAAADEPFRHALEDWHADALSVYSGLLVHNEISGGIFHGPVVQTHTAAGFSFGTPSAPGHGSSAAEPSEA